jgi:hypothetical protein
MIGHRLPEARSGWRGSESGVPYWGAVNQGFFMYANDWQAIGFMEIEMLRSSPEFAGRPAP